MELTNPITDSPVVKKIVVFADTTWSIGCVHREIANHLTEYEWIFVDWQHFEWEELTSHLNACFLCLTNIVCISFLRDAGLDRFFPKCLFMSHGCPDNQAVSIQDLSPQWIYGITSDFIRPLFPPNVRIFLMPNGINPASFSYKEREGHIHRLGWCGAPQVPIKRSQWVSEIANQSRLPYSMTSGTLTQHQVREWYSTVDLLLITSESETGPLPAFEAIVSGIPVLGTPVGNFSYVPGPKFNTIQDAVALVIEYKRNPIKTRQLIQDQYEYVIKHYTYASIAPLWKDAFSAF